MSLTVHLLGAALCLLSLYLSYRCFLSAPTGRVDAGPSATTRVLPFAARAARTGSSNSDHPQEAA
jgi:hypothetical protein